MTYDDFKERYQWMTPMAFGWWLEDSLATNRVDVDTLPPEPGLLGCPVCGNKQGTCFPWGNHR